MAKVSIVAGTTSYTVNLFIRDSSSTTGAGLTGLVYNSGSLTAYYVLPKAASAAITLATLAAATSAWSSGGFKEVDATNLPGVYRFDIPNAAIAASNVSSMIMLKGATNMEPCVLEIELTATNNQDAVRAGMTALPNAAAAASGGLIINGSNAGTVTLAALTVTGAFTISDGLAITRSTTGPAISGTGNGSGAGMLLTGGATGRGATFAAGGSNAHGLYAGGAGTGTGIYANAGGTGVGMTISGGGTSGTALLINSGGGDGIVIAPSAGNGISITADGTSKHGIVVTGGTAGTSDGIKAVAGTGGVPIRGNITGNITGNLSGSIGSYTGDTPQTGDAFARIGAAGAGLTALGDTRIANLDAAVSSRMATYTQPTGFLASSFPSTVASSSEVTAIQNNTRVVRVVPDVIERPDSGTVTYRVELMLYDSTGNMEAPDSAPTIALVNQAGTDRSSRLDSTTMASVSTGRYRAIYTADSADTLEQLVWTFSIVEGGVTRVYGNNSLIVDTSAVDFTSSDRTMLTNISNKLPSRAYLAGTTDSTGAIPAADKTGYSISGSKTTLDALNDITAASVWAVGTRRVSDATNITSDGATIDQTKIAHLDADVSSRMATFSYTAPDNSGIAAIKTVTDHLATALVLDGAVYQFTANALELAPTGGSAPTAAEVADAVWDEAIADHDDAGSTGEALAGAGSAGDPWATALPGSYGAGTAGKIIGDNIDATISSRGTSSYAGGDTSGTTTLLARLTSIRAGLLDNLDAAVSSRSTYAGADTAGTTTLLSRVTGAVVLQSVWSDAKAAFIDAAITSRLAAGSYTAPDNAGISAVKAKTDNLPSDPADESLIIAATDAIMSRIGAAGAGLTALGDSRLANLDAAVSTRLATSGYTAPDNADIVLVKAVTDHLATTLVSDGAVYQFTANALELGPSGGGGGSAPTAEEVADAVWDELLAGHADAGSTGEALAAIQATGGGLTEDQAEQFDGIQAVINAINPAGVSYIGPVLEGGQHLITMRGDDYTADSPRGPLRWVPAGGDDDLWPDLTGATVAFTSRRRVDDEEELTVAGSIENPAGPNKAIVIELTAEQTDALTPGDDDMPRKSNKFDVRVTLQNGDIWTPIRGGDNLGAGGHTIIENQTRD